MVEAQAHERHDLDHAQALLQAPREERTVLRGHEDTWARKGAPARDQCLEVFGALPDRMAEERQRRAIAGDAARMLDHQSGALRDRLAHFPPAIVAMHQATDLVAGFDISLDRWPDRIAGNLRPDGMTGHAGDGRADRETQRRIQGE